MHWIQILTFLQQIAVTAECQYLNRIFSDVEDQIKLQPQSILRNYRAKNAKCQKLKGTFSDVEDQITLQPQSILSRTLALIPIVGKIRVSFPQINKCYYSYE